MDKTPGQVARQTWRESERQTDCFDQVAAAVIAHVIPQIEAKARAAAIEDAAKECDGSSKAGMYIAADIRALASAPPGYVCLPDTPYRHMAEDGSTIRHAAWLSTTDRNQKWYGTPLYAKELK
jgi:hypothetical protein